MEERISMHSHKPQATSKPLLFSHTHSLTAQLAQPLTAAYAHVPSRHQHWLLVVHCTLVVVLESRSELHSYVDTYQRIKRKFHCNA